MKLSIKLFEPLINAILSNWIFVLCAILVIIVLIWATYASGRVKKALKAAAGVLIFYLWFSIVDWFIMPFVSTAYGELVYEAIRILFYIIPIAYLIFSNVFKGDSEE